MSKNVVLWMEDSEGVTETAVGFIWLCEAGDVNYWNHFLNRYCTKSGVVRVTQSKFPGEVDVMPEDFE